MTYFSFNLPATGVDAYSHMHTFGSKFDSPISWKIPRLRARLLSRKLSENGGGKED